MRRPIVHALAALALATAAPALAGCATQAVQQAQILPIKGLYLAEIAYGGFVDTANAAIDAGVLTGENKVRVQAVDRQAYGYLVLARQGKGPAEAVLTVIATAQPFLPIRHTP